MATMRLRAGVLTLAVLGLGPLAPAARADSITFINGFGVGGPAELVDFDAFDPALGTLSAVTVSIVASGGVALQPPPPTGPVPVPYPVIVGLEFELDGNGSQFFEFGGPARALAPAVALGLGEPMFVPIGLFSLNFTFDDLTELIGFSVPSAQGVAPPPTVNGNRDAFVLGPATVESLLLTRVGLVVASDGPLPAVVSSVLNGSIQVTYDYTPRPVPEPAVAVLASIGAIMSLRRRRRLHR